MSPWCSVVNLNSLCIPNGLSTKKCSGSLARTFHKSLNLPIVDISPFIQRPDSRALDCTFKIGGEPLRLGGFGRGLVSAAVSLEFLGSTAMAIIFVWRNSAFLFPQYDMFWIAVVSSCAILPTCWYVCIWILCPLKAPSHWIVAFDRCRLLNVSELGMLSTRYRQSSPYLLSRHCIWCPFQRSMRF